MKQSRSRLILLSFLLLLYIAPVIFISSFASPAIPAEQHMIKDFSVSAEWYDSAWFYRKSITIKPDSGIAGTDYQVFIEVTYDSDMKEDFADVIFVDEDHEIVLDHWLETKTNSTSADYWVEVQDYISENQPVTIYMYYGNDDAATSSNGTATFLFFDDFENNNFDRWDSADPGWSVVSDRVQNGSYAAFADSSVANYGDALDYNFTSAITHDFMIHFYANTQVESGTMKSPVMLGRDSSYTNTDFVYILEDDIVHHNNVEYINYATGSFDDDTWYRLELAVDVSESKGTLFQDRVEKNELTLADRSGGTVNGLGALRPRCDNNDVEDFWLDNVYVRKWVLVEPLIDSWGEKEEYTLPAQWEVVGEAELIFSVPIDETGLNMALILLGLIMIPASTLYAVKGGKDEMSTDKLFYVLIAFVIGWALVLGGIYA